MKMGPLEDFAFDSVLDKFDRIGIAYSGGLDSTVLLHLLTQKKEFKDKIDAIHVNHSISRDSNKWEEFCRENGFILIALDEIAKMEEGDFYDPWHTTIIGSTKITSYISEIIINKISNTSF